MKKSMLSVIGVLLIILFIIQTTANAEIVSNRLLIIDNEVSGKHIYKQKVLVLCFDPVFPMAQNKRQHDLMKSWNDPKELSNQFIKAMQESSHGNALYEIVEWDDINELPLAINGFSYSIDGYYQAFVQAKKRSDYWNASNWEHFGTFDYNNYMELYDVYNRVNSGEIDEVWIFTGPMTGADGYETIMIGRDTYWCNSPPMVRSDCPPFVCYVFNYERDVGCMLEDAGHRMESIMSETFGWNTNKPISQMNDWEIFSLYDMIAPGNAGCGNVHFAPNSESDYDWGNKKKVESTCNDWCNYPNMTGEKAWVNKKTWGNGDMAKHHEWWFGCIPHVSGTNADSGKYNNWWLYFKYPELATGKANSTSPDIVDAVDLIALPIIYTPTTVHTGDTVYFDSGVENDGLQDTGAFNIKWFVNEEELGYGGHCGVPANQTIMNDNSQFTWIPQTPGSYTISFIVDADDFFHENDTKNNIVSTVILIK